MAKRRTWWAGDFKLAAVARMEPAAGNRTMRADRPITRVEAFAPLQTLRCKRCRQRHPRDMPSPA